MIVIAVNIVYKIDYNSLDWVPYMMPVLPDNQIIIPRPVIWFYLDQQVFGTERKLHI